MPEEKEEKKEEGMERQIVIFNLGKEEFGVNINEVREIIRMEQITKIPNTQDHIEGVINLRGGIIVVIDLAMKLGLPDKEVDKNTRIIVIEVNKNTVGMVVDSATEVLRLSKDQIEPAPAVITEKIHSDYIEGVGILDERLLILLDLAKVLQAKDIEHVKKIQESAPKPAEKKEDAKEEPKEGKAAAEKIEAKVEQNTVATEGKGIAAASAEVKGKKAQTEVKKVKKK